MCDWCGKFKVDPMKADDDHVSYPLGWRMMQWCTEKDAIISKKDAILWFNKHWCGECDPRKKLASEVENE